MPNYPHKRINTKLECDPVTVYTSVLMTALQHSNLSNKSWLEGSIRARRFKELLEWAERPSPQMYDSAVSYLTEAQFAALIRKYPFDEKLVPGINPRDVAVKKFMASEHSCKRQNQRYRVKRKSFDPHAQFFAYVRDYIVKVIGVKPDLPAVLSMCDFTEGASVGVHGNRTNTMRKLFAKRWSVTPTALPYAMTALWLNVHARLSILPGAVKCYDADEFRRIVKSRVDLVRCNNISFVPKTAKTHRSIAVEPLLNGFVQKGTDEYLRLKLAKVGIDLRDQRVNQLLARSGSMMTTNPFCTIDLSAASDSLATGVVEDLLPPDWFEFLSDIRSPGYRMNGQTYKFEKFCSMGNGFCFPLQTLIFAGVCHAASRIVDRTPFSEAMKTFSVYGDDIIVKQNVALYVIEMLRNIGFKTNRDKTFVCGPFRESCGSDWYNGQDVRPVHLDKPFTDLRDVFAFHNSTYKSPMVENILTGAREYLRSIVSGRYMRPGKEPGDTCFSVPYDLAMGSKGCNWNRDVHAFEWREILSLPLPDSLKHLSSVERSDALMYAALRGATPDMPYSVRYASRAKVVRVCRPWKGGYAWTPSSHYVETVQDARKAIRNLQSFL